MEGFTNPALDYATGVSGPALGDDTHARSLLFLHPGVKASGYFLLLDKVEGTGSGNVKTIFHPNTLATTGIQTVSKGEEYKAVINGYTSSPGKVGLSIFYGTKPLSVRMTKGVIAGFKGSFEGGALVAEYSRSGISSRRASNSLTLFSPYTAAHPKPKLARIAKGTLNGVKVVSAGGAVDVMFHGDGNPEGAYERRSFKGPFVFYRNSPTGFYFLRKGTRFFDSTNQVGVLSAKPVSIHVEDTVGSIVSPGTEVTFFRPGILAVRLGSSEAKILEAGKGKIKVLVPAGTWPLRLTTNSSMRPLPKEGASGKVDVKNGTSSRYMRYLDPKSSRFYDISGKTRPANE